MSNENGTSYSGKEWVKSALKLDGMSPLGEAVADLLGDTFLGIYHLPSRSLQKIDWKNDHFISLVYHGGLASVDSNELTRLIVLAHDRMIRVEIDGAAPKYLRIAFHQRHNREGGDFWDRCPTLDSHIEKIRQHYTKVSQHA